MLRVLLLTGIAVLVTGCEQTCRNDGQCSLPAVCGEEHHCVVPQPRADGADCAHDQHCAGGVCLMSPQGNVCATACEGAVDCPSHRCTPSVDARPAGSTLRLTCLVEGGDRYAAETCRRDVDCRTGLCFDDHCTSPCGACPTEFACQPATITRGALSLDHGVCTWWPEQPVLELGAVDTSVASPKTIEFTLPEGFGAFTLVLEAADDSVLSVSRLTGPNGAVYIGGERVDGGPSPDFARCSSNPGTATVLVPGTDLPAAQVVAGKYSLDVVSYEQAGFPLTPTRNVAHVDRVAAVMKRPARGGVVDLTIHVAPETGLSVADGGNAFVRTMVDRFAQLSREKLGVTVGSTVMVALPIDAGVKLDTVAQNRALWAAQSVGTAGRRGIDVMLVKSLSFAGGVAGAVPGAPGVYGRGVSGLTLAPLGSGPAATGTLLAHEVDHFLGLWHTSDDFYGPDLISDTPSCANPSGSGCADARNLMFPSFPTGDPLILSPGQQQVLEGSPWIYRRIHPEACGARDVVGLTQSQVAGGTLVGAETGFIGTCGGSGAERVHLYRLETGARRIEAKVTATGFVPVVYLRQATCLADAPELACAVGDGGVAVAQVDSPNPGAVFIVVDSMGDAGVFELNVTVTR